MSENQVNDNNNTPSAPLGKSLSFRERLAATKKTRWIRFAVVSVVFLMWVVWLGTWWVALFWLLLFDIYITGYIPLTWWKNSKSPVVRSVMSWVDAIVYALVLVYFVFAFIGQNYQIPSSSLEKSLLVGDYLWVNKMAYGPRVPQTPIHFPLVQHTFPIVNTKSYIEHPQLKYHRLKGLGSVERGDIVVFNFPAGDTVATNMQQADYYTLIREFGRNYVENNRQMFGEIIYRPVDRRENYVKRVLGLPGDYLKIKKGVVYVNGEPLPQPENQQFNYFVQMPGNAMLTDAQFDLLGISVDDRNIIDVDPSQAENWTYAGFAIEPGVTPVIYRMPLTRAMVKQLEEMNAHLFQEYPEPNGHPDMYPNSDISADWTRADYALDLTNRSADGKLHTGLWIPRKGATVKLDAKTWQLYHRLIRNYEGHPDAYISDGVVYIDGKPCKWYTFDMDYYFMMGDNRDNSADSRYWGLVPEDHIVGKPMVVLASFDKDKSLFNGGLRLDRLFKRVKNE